MKRAIWQAADEWLTRWGKDGEMLEEADRAREMMSCLSCGLDITALGDVPKKTSRSSYQITGLTMTQLT